MVRGRELEFGVPFPGGTLPREKWTRTGWKDDGKPFDWEGLFGRKAARVLDLGCGNGRYLIGSAIQRPDHDHLGIDLVQRAIDFAAHRANQRGLANVRFVVGDAIAWLFERLASDFVDEIHIYHPQPYFEAGMASRRLLTPEFLERSWKVLRPDGVLVLQTDNRAYWRYLEQAVPKYFDPKVMPGPWPDAPRGRTRREILARLNGLTIWRMVAYRRAKPLEMSIPHPNFNAKS